MDSILGSIAPLVLEYSIGPIARHVSYPFNYKSKVTRLEDGVKKLKSARDDRKLWVDEHERDGKEISQVVLDWLKDVTEFIEKEEAELGLANEKTKKKCCVGFCPNLKTRYQVSKKAEQKAVVAARFSEKNGTFSTDQHVHTPSLQCIEGFSSKDFEALESRMSILKDIMNALASVDVNTIGVHGVGGVGKTTLAREVGRKAREEKLFDEVIMATVTIDVDVINVQKTIADFLGLHFNEESKEGRAARLRERLMKKEKKILIILDDLWKKLKLEEVGIPQPDEHNGCKLLLTSRDSNVLSNEMSSQKLFRISALAGDEAWDLFQKMSNSSFADRELQCIAKDVAEVCAGLPIAIVTVASSLKSKSLFEWRNALTKLKATPSKDLTEMQATVYHPIEFSYNKLESGELRSTFLLCCQMGYNATIGDLLKYGIGLGLFDVDTLENAQDRVYSLVQQLKTRCLLLQGDSDRQLVMHDLVRDVGRWIASRDHGVVIVDDRNNRKEWADEEKIKTYRSIWIYNNVDELQEELQCPDLVFLHIDGNNGGFQLPDNLFKGLYQLKVLSLTGFNFSSLPSSVGLLKSLKTLSFYHSSQLGDVRIVGGLENLEVLSFAKSSIRHLPKEIGQLSKLKLLDLSDCYTLEVIPSSVLSKLSRLEELYMANSFDSWEIEGGDNASLTELKQLHSLSNLEINIRDANLIQDGVFSEKLCRYKIYICEGRFYWYTGGEIEIVKTLRLKLGANSNMPNGVLQLLKETQDLYLDGVKNILCELDREGFPKLRRLHLLDSPGVKYLVGLRDPLVAFPMLETLILDNLVSLEKVCQCRLKMQSFSKLWYVRVKGCNKLTHLFSFMVAQGLLQLQEIEVSDCESMEEIVGEGDKSEAAMDEIVFSKLRILTLRNLPKLNSFCSKQDPKTSITPLFNGQTLHLDSVRCDALWHGPLAGVGNSFLNLTEVWVVWCDNMKYAFSYSLTKHLSQLKKLSLSRCKEMEEVIGGSEGEEEQSMNNKVIVFPQLLQLRLRGLWKLKRFCKGYLLNCPLLKELEIIDCPDLKTFITREHEEMRLEGMDQNATHIPPALFDDMISFPDLKTLNLQSISCETLWRGPLEVVGNSFQNLTELCVRGCENMKYVCSHSLAKHLCQLKKLDLYYCNEMEEVIGMEEEKSEEEIVFPQLLQLELCNLGKLKRFCKSYLLECPLLEELKIKSCPDLMAFNSWEHEEMRSVGMDQNAMPTPPTLLRKLRRFCKGYLKTFITGEHEEMRLEGMDQNATPALFDDMEQKQLCLSKATSKQHLKTSHTSFLNGQISFPNLKTWILESIKCDTLWHGQLAAVGNSFQNLTDLSVKRCENMKYLCSYSLTKHLSQLKKLGLYNCNEMEEVIGREEERPEGEIVFPELLQLELCDLEKLKRFCKGYLLKCPLLKELDIKKCPDLKTFISREHEEMRLEQNATPALFNDMVFFPSLVEMHIEMEIWDLDSMESIWDNQLASESFGELKKLHIYSCSKLRKVFPSAHHERFQKLEELSILNSKLVEEIFEEGSNTHVISFQLRKLDLGLLPKLKNVFPYSIATHLQKLESMYISGSGVEEIVSKAKMEGEMTVHFEFPELTSLTFSGVPKLRRWYPGMHTLVIPKLKRLDTQMPLLPVLSQRKGTCNLRELKLYGKREYESKPWHDDFPANLFATLKVLELYDFHDWEGIPVSILQELHKCEKISVEECAFEELFSFDGSVTDDVVEDHCNLPRLKHLELSTLGDMRYICEQQNHIFHLFRSLETLKLKYCDSLVSVVRPSSTTVSFQNLTSLILWECNKLVNIVTTTTAKSLSNLVTLWVQRCSMVTEIVEGEDDGDDDEITFTKLQTLRLKDLRSLTSFCSGNYGFSFPCLNEVTVVRCPKMKLFSPGLLLNTPELSNVKVSLKGYPYKKECWEGNLNATIRQLHTEMVGFEGFTSLKLSEFPELREIWHGQLHLEAFSQLKELEVDGCPNFSIAVPFNLMPCLKKLRELSVSECDSLEGVFDWDKLLLNPDSGYIQLPELYKLCLRDLPRLHHIFPTHPRSILDFQNFGKLSLSNCSSLRNVLKTSMARWLVGLRTIEIINCVALEEIITRQGSAGEISKLFPRLKIVVLESLPNLISFNSGSDILEFSSLESITVDKCPQVKPFISSFLRGQASKAVYKIHPGATTSAAIDDDKVVFPNLTELRMDWNDAMEEIGRGEFQAKFFCQLRTLAIINLPHHHLTFPSHFLLRFHNLENLTLKNAMFEEITIHEEDTSVGSLEKLRNLTLSNLPRLVHLGGEGSPLNSIFQNLETMKVFECGRLETLFPSTISFQSLTTLQVSKCHKLLSLMTCTAAKSLALLTRMSITECQMLEQIVGNEESVAGSEVTLTKLECLELHCLPSLLGFSLWICAFTFPSLKDVVVKECPKMKIFSQGVVTAPKLRRVIQTEGKEKWCWKGSLNATIQKLYMDQAMLQSSQPRSPKSSNLDVEAGQLVRNGKSHMSEEPSSVDFCEIKNPSVTKDLSSDATTKHNEEHEDRSLSTPMDIPSISQAQMDDFSTDKNKTIPPPSTEQSVSRDATDTPIFHNQQGVSSLDQESLDKSDPASRPREEEVNLIALLRKQDELLRTQEQQLRKQEQQLRTQEQQLRTQEQLHRQFLEKLGTSFPPPPPTT